MRTESLKYIGILTILSHLLCFPVSFIIYELKPLFFDEPAQVTTKTVDVFMKQQLKQYTLKKSVVFVAQSDKVQNIFVHRRFLIRTGLTPSLPECFMKFCKASLTFESVDEIL